LETEGPAPPDQWIGVWVDDVDAMFARVKAAGVPVEQPENKFYGIRIFQVTDPRAIRGALGSAALTSPGLRNRTDCRD